MKVEIYGLVCPDTHRVRYVGKSKNAKKRFHQHVCSSRNDIRYQNTHLHRWMKKLDREGRKPQLIILEVVDEGDWVTREKHWISHFGLENLCNMNAGGFEPPNATGRVLSMDTRLKLSEMKKGKAIWVNGKNHPMSGREHPRKGTSIHTEERIAKFRQEKMGVKNPMYGKRPSDLNIKALVERISKPVAQIDDNGNTIKTWNTIREASRELGLYDGAITRVCKGEYKHTKGMRFKYL